MKIGWNLSPLLSKIYSLNLFRKGLIGLLAISCVPTVYLLIALICTYIPVNVQPMHNHTDHTVYLRSNGVHVDLVLPIDESSPTRLRGLEYTPLDRYIAYGWGDRKFYLETPQWKDLTVRNGLSALILPTPSLMHVTRFHKLSDQWVPINLTSVQNEKLQEYIAAGFKLDSANGKIILAQPGYFHNDAFYEANGDFTCLRTCNSWVNQGLKQSGMKACFWTPFSFRLLSLYK